MKLIARLAALFCLAAGLAFAESWSGTLVDAKCFAAEQRNSGPKDTLIYVDRDVNLEVRYCHPTAKTKTFGIVQPGGVLMNLDAAGNAKAADLVRQAGKTESLWVQVNGRQNRNTIDMNSLSAAQ